MSNNSRDGGGGIETTEDSSSHKSKDECSLAEGDQEDLKKVTQHNTKIAQDGSVDEITLCGVCGWSPKWLQVLASKKTYVLVYSLIGMSYFTLGTYLVGTITTLEKRFKIPSKTSGFIMCAWDIGSLSSSLVMAYIGSKGHKTRWVAFGTFLVGISCYIHLMPHYLFGPGDDAIAAANPHNKMAMDSSSGGTKTCGSNEILTEDCSNDGTYSLPTLILITANIVLGVGTAMYYSLGVAYLDDNVRKNKLPWLLALTMCIRMLGPSLGFQFASLALDKYVDPSLNVTITPSDPRWVGAWWYGWAPFGLFNILLSFVMILFPRILPRAALREKKSGQTLKPTNESSFKDFKETIMRLLKNPVLVFNSMSTTFFMMGMIGYWSFMPKYMETQFQQSASQASLITGSVGLVCTGAGVLVSGAVVSKFKPRPRFLAAWNIFVEFLDVLGHITYAFLGCPSRSLHGHMAPDDTWSLLSDCNAVCNCSANIKYAPVCSLDKKTTFYSPCHAGCAFTQYINSTVSFTGCSCSEGATDGACPVDCSNNFILFILLLCFLRFFSATGRAGNIMIQFRSVSPEDKSVAIAALEALLSAVAFIPGPIFYGALLDSTCLVWGESCGQTGNCWLYNGASLRYLLNFTASGFLMCGTLLDFGVWWNVGGLKIYDDDEESDAAEDKQAAILQEEEELLLMRTLQSPVSIKKSDLDSLNVQNHN